MKIEQLDKGTLTRVIRILNPVQKRTTILFILAQFALGIIDFIGVLIVGIIGSLALSVISEVASDSKILKFVSILHLDEFSLNKQIAILCSLVVAIFILKTMLSILVTKKIMMFLGNIATELSGVLLKLTLERPLLFLENESSQKRLFAITRGVDYLTLFVLAPSIVLLADASILLVFALGLLVVQPVMTLIFALVFGVVGFFVYVKLHSRSGYLGKISAEFNISISAKIAEAFDLYREIVVRNARGYYINQILSLRKSLALSTAEFNLIPYIGKYVIEAVVIFSAVVLTLSQILINDAISGIITLTIFLAASTRIAPAVLRVQQGTIMIKGNLGMCLPTLDLIDKLGEYSDIREVSNDLVERNLVTSFEPTVSVKCVDFGYGTEESFQISNLNLEIRKGEKIAIVGPSGSGKSTLVDLILGVINPVSGEVLISSELPTIAFKKWPGLTAYVPQKVGIIDGSIFENLTFGFPREAFPEDVIDEALKSAALSEFISEQKSGKNSQVGENGSRLSEGQRQRIGIARALTTDPRLLILDEATSSLDGITEEIIGKSINNLGLETTVIMIAHRLSTVRNADRVIYFENGEIIADGTFEEVRKKLPNFDIQAKLMGL
jgi:ABC-type multidrug transport system fused ATPase/permease subunit